MGLCSRSKIILLGCAFGKPDKFPACAERLRRRDGNLPASAIKSAPKRLNMEPTLISVSVFFLNNIPDHGPVKLTVSSADQAPQLPAASLARTRQ